MKQVMNAFIDESKDSMIRHILEMVSYPSFTEDVEENTKCLQYVLGLAQNMGFRTMATSDMSVGVVEMGEGEECVGILVHVDVVGIGDPDKWTYGPFNGVYADGYLWGRGVSDDKGAVIMSLYAMRAVQKAAETFNRKIWLLIGTCEEGVWTDIDTFKKEFPVPDYGFSPDGQFPVFNEEKGYMDLILYFEEPDGETILALSAGDSPNTIPSKASAMLRNGKSIVAEGVSVHSSAPQDGKNAIVQLCRELEEAGVSFNFSRFILSHFSDEGVLIDFPLSEKPSEKGVISTFAPTVIGLEKGKVRVNINIRHKYGTTVEQVSRAFAEKADEYHYSMETGYALEPMRVDEDIPFLRLMAEVSREYGVDDGFRVAAGTTYAKSMDRFVSWGPIMPHEPQTAHMEDERLSAETMILATKMYARFIQRIVTEQGEQ